MKKSVKITIIIIAALVVIGLGVGIYFIVTSQHRTEQQRVETRGDQKNYDGQLKETPEEDDNSPEPSTPPEVADVANEPQNRKEHKVSNDARIGNYEVEDTYIMHSGNNYKHTFKGIHGKNGNAEEFVDGNESVMCYKRDDGTADRCVKRQMTEVNSAGLQKSHTKGSSITSDTRVAKKYLKFVSKETCPSGKGTCYVWQGETTHRKTFDYVYQYIVDKKGRPVKITQKASEESLKRGYDAPKTTIEITYRASVDKVSLPNVDASNDGTGA